ncbi:MAG: bifunctional diaminohydroxyphosphoribosylaminopyrimidine deaminase/5-amino-6-(5-phosphoribosylamino)uracil reductase RibD [Alphaproteobacteria bacterium]|nr:bifunctional diaminohydroxyphosphoribosylaminopyrimidine deaminase/5-amino-6-(5-phosphoribosylamino)uracil reductase RibD [Alphaproteobacteria bacterium]
MTLSRTVLSDAMRLAIEEARTWIGATAPNPPVGAAILDQNGKTLSLGVHQKAGGPHAEAAAIEQCREAGTLKHAHTLVVTLEPCNHFGKTPPCTETIIAAGIPNVAYGTPDPNADVAGGGAQRLRDAGLQVTAGILENECRQLIAYFAHCKTLHQPWITIKRAFTASGSMVPPAGQKTFTSSTSLALAHKMRKAADAIMTGSGTVLSDNPEFTVRHTTDHAGIMRDLAIIDRRRRVPTTYISAATGRRLNCALYDTPEEAMKIIYGTGKRHILVEAGPTLSDYLIKAGIWTLCMDIHQGEPDTVHYTFNPDAAIPFDITGFTIDSILPN